MQLGSIAGTNGVSGGIGGGAIGLGIVIDLHDQFSKNAIRVQRQMQMLGSASDKYLERIDRGLKGLNVGLGTLAVGAGVLATIAYPLKDAAKYEQSITNILNLYQKNRLELKNKLRQWF